MASWFDRKCIQDYLCEFWCNLDVPLLSYKHRAEAGYANLTFSDSGH